MVERWRDGADMVCMVRTDRAEEGFIKRIGTKAFYRLINVGRSDRVPPDAGDFRLLDRSVVEALRALPERTRFMKGLYAWVGFRTEAITYQPPPRGGGRSHYGLHALMRLSLSGITAFTTWPLRAASLTGFVLAIGAFIYGTDLVLSYWIDGHPISGWTTIVCGMMFFSGVQLMFLGIVGEYVGRIFDEVKRRPLYVVRRQSGRGLEKSP
jgi:glycosyltransferase involved in cell wall biosynthesis